jgi:hypothetical protein
MNKESMVNTIKYEIWKDIPEYEGMYQVSSFGRVKSLSRKTSNGRGYFLSKEKILSQSKNGSGYMSIVLSKNGKTSTKRVHKLVAICFLNHTPNGFKLVVDHKDNNPLNNHVDNLQLVTNRYNCSKNRSNGTSRYVGVSLRKDINKWRADIVINGKKKQLGYFDNEIDAKLEYDNALQNLKTNKTKPYYNGKK